VYEERERLLIPPSELLVLSSVEPPPSKEAFLKLSVEERLKVLGLLYMRQTSNVSSCNIRTIDLNQWIADTQARIAEKGKAK
jgi:hypothetical protein